MKCRLLIWLIGLWLTLFALSADAATLNVTAKGRNDAVAQTNVGVNAVRQSMRTLVTDEFLRVNQERIRSEVILQSGRFVRAITVTDRQQQGSLIILTASVDVDVSALIKVLASMDMDEASRQRMTTALLDMENAAPADRPEQPPEEAVDDDGVAGGVGIYVQDVRVMANRLFSSNQLSFLLDTDTRNIVDALLVLDIRDLHVRVDWQKESVILFFTPPDPARMRSTLAEGRTLQDVFAILGLEASRLPQDLHPELVRRLERPPSAPPGILKVQDARIYLGQAGRFTIAGRCQEDVAKAMEQIRQGTMPFTVQGTAPLRYTYWWPLPLEDGKEAAQDAADRLVVSATTELEPAPGGWIFRSHTDLGGRCPELTNVGPMDLSGSLIAGRQPPFVLMGLANGAYLSAWLDALGEEEDPGLAVCRVLLEKLDSGLLSLGGGQVITPPLRFPAVTLSLKGDPEALQSLMAYGALADDGQEITVAGWDKVRLHALDEVAGTPLNMVLALHDNTLIGGFMDVQALTYPRQNARAVLTAALAGSGLALPKAVSGVSLIDVRQFWQEARVLLDDISIALLLEVLAPDARQALQRLFSTTPPISVVVGWTESPDMTRSVGYIAVTAEDSTEFYQALKNLIDVLDKDAQHDSAPGQHLAECLERQTVRPVLENRDRTAPPEPLFLEGNRGMGLPRKVASPEDCFPGEEQAENSVWPLAAH